MQVMRRLPEPVKTFLRRARFYLALVFSGRARYAAYLIEMRLRGVDLCWQSARDLGLAEERAHDHADSGGPELARVLRRIGLRRECAILDLGCGKGGALITFGRLGFNRVDGIELSPQMCKVARRNLARMRMTKSRVMECDAGTFFELDSYDVVYMYNPFPAAVVSAVVSNLADSLARVPRPLTVIYLNPTCHDSVVQGPFEKCQELPAGRHMLIVYRSCPPA